jgi:hypothetical protein
MEGNMTNQRALADEVIREFNEIVDSFELQKVLLLQCDHHTELTGEDLCEAAEAVINKFSAATQTENRILTEMKVCVNSSKGGYLRSTTTIQYGALFEGPEDGPAYNKDALEIFGHRVGTIVCWPYCREMFSSLTAKSGLPEITLPLHKAGSTKLKEEE